MDDRRCGSPHADGNGVTFAGPIFDHSKVAIIDEFLRSGLPLTNPFFYKAGSSTSLPYYYLWHFSAAEIGRLTGASAWEADVAMTWFTSFSSLHIVMGLAFWISRSYRACFGAIAVCATASLRPYIGQLFGYDVAYDLTGYPTGFGAWLFQAAWAPQHIQSAGCSVVALLMIARVGCNRYLPSVTLGLVVAAAYASSFWVGGIVLPIQLALAFIVMLQAGESTPIRLVWSLSLAAAVAVVFASPLIVEQALAMSARQGGFPISFSSVMVLGDVIPEWSRPVLDPLAFYLVYLTVELQVCYVIGLPMLARLVGARSAHLGRRHQVLVLAAAVVVSLLATGFLSSTVTANNDLGWRAVLPAVLILVAISGAGMAAAIRQRVTIRRVLMFAVFLLAAFQAVLVLSSNLFPTPTGSGREFTGSIELWRDVRSVSSPLQRVVNNPDYLGKVTPWPVNISWALLSNRRSCYAARNLVEALVPLPREELDEIDALFRRVFTQGPESGDVRRLAFEFGCEIAIVTVDDPIWPIDPFAENLTYELVVARRDRWRIYRRRNESMPSSTAPP